MSCFRQRLCAQRATLATARQILMAEGGIPPGKKSHTSCLACISVGLQSSTQKLLATIQGTKVIQAGVKVALGVDHSMAVLQRARPGRQHTTEPVLSVQLLLFCTAAWRVGHCKRSHCLGPSSSSPVHCSPRFSACWPSCNCPLWLLKFPHMPQVRLE